MKIIDNNNWNRKEHFEFFSKYDNPFFGIVTEIDCTQAYNKCKQDGISFFAFYLHKSLLSANNVDPLKYRIYKEEVVVCDSIHASSTVGRKDGTFGFSFVKHTDNFIDFNNELKKEIDLVQNSNGLRFNDDAKRVDVIHYSTLPWNKFTGLSHARNYNTSDSVPKITFGRAFEKDSRRLLPVSIDAHHGLVDGIHIAQFLELFQNAMAE